MGSLEQHGPHLPLSTDTVVARAVAAGAVTSLGAAALWLAPAWAYGASGEHQGFAGTISIGHEALRAVLVEIGRSASTWCPRLVVVNGHGGNLPTVAEAVVQLRCEGRDASWFACVPAGPDAHAGRAETSLVMALAPVSVREDLARPGALDTLDRMLPRLRAGGVAAVSASGVLGDPTGASAPEGRSLLAGMVAELAAALTRGRVDDAGRLRAPVPSAAAGVEAWVR